MSSDDNHLAVPETDSKPGSELLSELASLERALRAWDLNAIASGEAEVHIALERTRSGLAPEPETLRLLMSSVERCRRLSQQGAELAGCMTRLGALTYSSPGADTERWEDGSSPAPGSRGSAREHPADSQGGKRTDGTA